MTHHQQWQYLFRKNMSLRFKRAEAYWAYGEKFYGFRIYATREQLLNFFKDYASIERACRDVLREREFSLPTEADSKRYEKAAEFKRWKDKMPSKERADFEKAFGEGSYKEENDDEEMEEFSRSVLV